MSTTLDVSGLDRIATKLATLTNVDATPLMRTWMEIINQDNRTGILAGLDKDGVPMIPVTYRPKPAPGHRVTKPPHGKTQAELRAELKRFRLNQRTRLKKGIFSGLTGIGPSLVERNNNLTTAQYQLLGGPPLAPRDQFSRVITNLKTTFGGPKHGAAQWFAEGAWDEVVNAKGTQFLRYHFDGIGQKRRDLRGVRPSGIAKAVQALANWARLYVREHFGR